MTKHLQPWLSSLVLLSGLIFTAEPAFARDKASTAALDLARQLNQAFVDVAETVSPSVVVIQVSHKASVAEKEDESNPFYEFFRKQMEEERKNRRRGGSRGPVYDGEGSGIVLTKDGYILTNGHVVEGVDKIRVRFRDGKEYDAEIRGVDTQSDIAVIKVNAANLVTAKLGDSSKTRVGEFAIAIGAPFEFDYSVTFGHISAKGRSKILNDPSMDQDFIQTDAVINPGNSGGPLVNIDGEVIGINTLISGIGTGIGFAIPINLAHEISDKLISDGKFVRSWLGVQIAALAESDLKDVVKNVDRGVVVTRLVNGGPAAKSDLKPGDVIITVDGHSVGTAQELKSEIRSKTVGREVNLDVLRGETRLKIKVKPEAWPEESQQLASRERPGLSPTRTFGLHVSPLTGELAEQFNVENTQGVIVTEVDKESLAYTKGLRAGDIITEINHKPVTTGRQFREAIRQANSQKGVIINYISDGESKFQVLKEEKEEAK